MAPERQTLRGAIEEAARSAAQRWLSTRVPLVVILTAAAALLLTARGPSPEGGWASKLAPHGASDVGQVVWVTPPRAGQWSQGLVLARQAGTGGQGRDVFLFEGLVEAGGGPLRVRRVGNLTRTPDADDQLMAVGEAEGQDVAVVGHTLEGAYTGLTLFNLGGDPTAAVDAQGRPRPPGDQLRIGWIRAQEDGSFRGVGRHHYSLAEPVPSMELRLEEGGRVVVESGDALRATIDAGTGELLSGEGALSHSVQPWVLGKWSTYLANRARAIEAVGPRKVAVAERIALDVMELVRRSWYGTVGDETEALTEELADEPTVALPEFEAPVGGIPVGGDAAWPPPDLEPMEGVKAVANEGVWKPWVPEWVGQGDVGEGPWPVYRTVIRTNPKRSYDPIVLIALDMRQLELHLQAGTHNPRSTTGYRGTGQIPRDPALIRRLVLAFNGGFKTSHGAYGMMLDRKLFIPAKPATATLTFHDDGSLKMGTWPGEAPMGNYNKERSFASRAADADDAPPPPEDVVTFRQNLPPLLAGGEINPQGAVRWGGTVEELNAANTPRSGICVRPEHTLVYAWGAATSAEELALAMKRAGCVYGMHLDMNPFHTGIVQYHVPLEAGELPEEDEKTGFVGALQEIPARKMWFDWYRYLRTDLKDFFYVTRRRSLAARAAAGLPQGHSPWSSKGLPVEYDGLKPLALVSRSDDVQVLALEADRFEATLIEGKPFEATTPSWGEVQLAIVPGAPPEGGELLPEPTEVEPLWRRGPTPGPALTLQEGRLDVLLDGAGLPEGQPAAPGRLLIKDGAYTRLDLASLQSPVIALRTATGVVELVTCDGCRGDALKPLLDRLPAETAVVLTSGRAFAVSSNTEGAWVEVVKTPYPDPTRPRVKLVPREFVAPVGALRYEGPVGE